MNFNLASRKYLTVAFSPLKINRRQPDVSSLRYSLETSDQRAFSAPISSQNNFNIFNLLLEQLHFTIKFTFWLYEGMGSDVTTFQLPMCFSKKHRN